MTLEGKRALVLGLGKSGLAAVHFLVAHGAIVAAADARVRNQLAAAAASLERLPVCLHFGGHPDSLLAEQDLIVPSPGVPWDLPGLVRARQQGVAVCGELELAADALRGRVIGVTGTNGKTTTVSLIDHVLRRAGVSGKLAGNVGTPVLEIADDSRCEDWHVLELSSFQLEASSSFRCNVAAVLNVTPDHLDRHSDFAEYAAAKARILRNQRSGDSAVLNADDPHCRALEPAARGAVVRFGVQCAEDVDACAAEGRIRYRGQDITDTDLPIKGDHNLENALAAVAACALAGIRVDVIGQALKSFQPVEHRMEFVATIRGVDYYNDSKATNVAAAVKACGSFPRGLWAIVGGQDKGSDYAPLAAVLRRNARAALLIGEAAPLIRADLGGTVPVVEAGTLRAALDYAADQAKPGDTVLLAPACASFDQYQNYTQRGCDFREIVAGLGGGACR